MKEKNAPPEFPSAACSSRQIGRRTFVKTGLAVSIAFGVGTPRAEALTNFGFTVTNCCTASPIAVSLCDIWGVIKNNLSHQPTACYQVSANAGCTCSYPLGADGACGDGSIRSLQNNTNMQIAGGGTGLCCE